MTKTAGILVILLSSLWAQAETAGTAIPNNSCVPDQIDGVLPTGTVGYTMTRDCKKIRKVGNGYVRNFAFTKVDSIHCENKTYLVVKIYSPGYQPAESFELVDANDVWLK